MEGCQVTLPLPKYYHLPPVLHLTLYQTIILSMEGYENTLPLPLPKYPVIHMTFYQTIILSM